MIERQSKGNVLVTGGAGYIGSHTVLALKENGWGVVVLDDLSTGNASMLPSDVPLIEGDIADKELVLQILQSCNCIAVLHFAGSIVVSESVSNPTKYYRNNTLGTLTLLEACLESNLHNFIFSSTAAVYGNPTKVPVQEDDPTIPINPYGQSKLMVEQILKDVAHATPLRYGILRYFNVAGADPLGRIGQCTPNATHLLKVACQAVLGEDKKISIFGSDYNTPDGTCVRDYIHVSDLANAHVNVLEYLIQNKQSCLFNCGYGHGFSVAEVLQKVQEVSGTKLNITQVPRRAGDPAALIADSSKLRTTTGWQPQYDNLSLIIETALNWEKELLTL
jgi:UDP-glucose 4-epimerase